VLERPRGETVGRLFEIVLEGAAKVLFWVGGFCAVGGMFVVLGQSYIWLKSGHWTSVSVGMVLYAIGIPIPDFELSWVGLQKMIDGVIGFVIDLPASITLVVIGAVLSIVAEALEPKISGPSGAR
jgi:hypothetical protein